MTEQMAELMKKFQALQLGGEPVVNKHSVHPGGGLNALAAHIQIMNPDIQPLGYVFNRYVRWLPHVQTLI
ncbi:hypothetical protein D3C81_2015920 [compost metagenome]